MNQSEAIAEHVPLFWPLIATALSGLIAIVVATVASLGFIRKEARSVAETVSEHVSQGIVKELEVYMARNDSWRDSMEQWRISFHESVKALRSDMRDLMARQAVLEEVGRRAESIGEELREKIVGMERERAARHALEAERRERQAREEAK